MKKHLIVATVAALIGASVALADSADRLRGTTITVSWPSLGHFQNAESVIESFEEQTGINVEIDALPYLQLRDQQIKELSKNTGKYDLVSWVIMWKGEYVARGLLSPLAPFFDNAALADPDYDIDDIAKPYLVSGGLVGGKKGYLEGPNAVLYGVPFGAETSLLAYRKDIFEKHGISVPRNYAELRSAILNLQELGIPALTSRGRSGNDVTFAWLLHLGPMGGKIFDDNWTPVVNSPEAVEAAEFLRLVTQTGPEGITDNNFGNAAFSFLSGEAAMYLDNFKIASAARDPNFSHFKDKIGYASHPVGTRCSSETGGFAIGIPANSRNKEAAFLLLQYLTSKQGDQQMTDEGGDPIRISTFNKNQQSRPESSAVIGSLLCADTDWRPLIPEWDTIQNKVLGPALLEVTRSTKPVQDIMDKANADLTRLMGQADY